MTTTTDTTDTDLSGAQNCAPEPDADEGATDAGATAVEPSAAETDEAATVDTATPETPETGVEDQDDDTGGKGNKEAARYRRRLRETEQERDTLKATVVALQRAEVDRLATANGLKPAALWSSAELGDLLSDDGAVDAEKVSAAIAAAREQLGIPNPPPRGNFVKREGRSPGRPPKPSGKDAMVGVVMGGVAADG